MFKQLKKLCLAETRNLIRDKSFIYHNTGSNILGVAHCDTVFDAKGSKNFYHENDNYIFSPKLDDRAGVFTLLYFLPMNYRHVKFDILLTTDEEKGASTAINFVSEKQYNWIFEFDRQGTGAVLYDYEYTDDWVKACRRSFKLHIGSYSDICSIAQLNCCGINVGTGYYSQHRTNSYLCKADYLKQIRRFVNFYNINKDKFFRHDVLEANSYYENMYSDNWYNLYYQRDNPLIDDYRINNYDV